jgi:hypothetical protein
MLQRLEKNVLLHKTRKIVEYIYDFVEEKEELYFFSSRKIRGRDNFFRKPLLNPEIFRVGELFRKYP